MKNDNKFVIKNYQTIGAIIIGISLVLLPYAMLVMQNYILPVVGNRLAGSMPSQRQEKGVDVKGKEVSIPINANIRGDINKAEIVMVEFSDYECYFCNQFHPTIKSVFEKSNGKVAWIYKHFPLEQIHPNAKPAAIASQCVAKLGGQENFWKYTDILIENNKTFSSNFFETEAIKLGVNSASFKKCMADPAILKIVEENQAEGITFGINGTPNTIIAKKEGDKFIVLESINGALPEVAVQAIINKYLK